MEKVNKKKLEILLEDLRVPDVLDSRLEQYFTDSSLASSILFYAFYRGDIKDKAVADLGSGNGIFAYGSSMLGAKSVYAVEIDPELAETIEHNCEYLNVEVLNQDVSDFTEKVDTVIMNPPFGSVVPHADRPFLETAVRNASMIYSVHNEKSYKFVREFYFKHGTIISEYKIDILLKRSYSYHEKNFMKIPSVLFTVRTGK